MTYRLLNPWIFSALSLFAAASFAQTQDRGDAGPDYRLQPQDQITVSVFDEPDLGTSQRIDGNGKVSLPLLGDTELAGRTVREAESFIEERYREEDYLLKPQVTVTVASYAPRQFYVFGQVQSPGTKPFPLESSSIDIIQAISMAGDFSDLARTSAVRITRKKEDGSETTLVWDLEGVIRGRTDSEQDRSRYRIFPGDVIFVPERIF